ncbi:hypothetical protein AAC387_Pa02g5035 [Persea americana]
MFRIRTIFMRNRPAPEEMTVDPTVNLPIPVHFRCPISLDLMKDPVTISTGITYDRQSIETWLDAGNRTCPVTKQELKSLEQIPNHTILRMIQNWCVANHSLGVERIPTPRIPATQAEVSKILMEIGKASREGDLIRCGKLVKKMNVLGRESDRNRRCIVAIGTTSGVLSAAFESFAAASEDNYVEGMEEILSMLAWMFPLDEEARSHLLSHASLHWMVWLLNCGNLAGRRNAALVVKDLASSSEQLVLDSLTETEGLIEALFKVLKEPICPVTTKASLMAVFYFVSSPSSSSKTASRFIEIGLVPLLLEMLVGSDKSVCEKALGVLDGIFGWEEGREKAYNHALTVPVLVKKILRVSDLATEFTISALWKLCGNYRGEDGGILVESLQVGAFQKVLVVLQVGCSEKTKEKATGLLKLLNANKMRGECIDSMDFKQLKRPF